MNPGLLMRCHYSSVVCCGVIANIIALLVSFSDILTSSIQPGSDSASELLIFRH